MTKYLQMKGSVIAIAVFCAVLWGSAFPVTKLSYAEMQIAADDTMAKIVLAGLRFLLAGLIVLVGMVLVNYRALIVPRRKIMTLVIFGTVQTAVQYYFFYIGLSNTTGMKGSILASSAAFFTVMIAHYFYKNDRLNWRKVIGILAGFSGIVLVNWGQSFQLSFTFTGEGYMILAAITGAVGTIMGKEMAAGIHPFALTGWQLSIGAVLLLLIGLPGLETGAMVFTPFGWGLLIYAAILSSVAFALWYALLKYNKAGEISLYKFVIPLSGTFLSAVFLPGESVTIYVLAALVLMTVGFFAINYEGKKHV